MPGLFIQRHAEAAGLYADVSAVYTHMVSAAKQDQTYETEVEEKNGVHTAKVYYQEPKVKIPVWKQLMKTWRFLKANELGIQAVSGSVPNFDLVHVHVLTRLGVIALYFKWKYGTPYVITEHWTRYLNLTQRFKGFFRKFLTRMVVKRAAVVTAVSQDLIKAMQSHGLKNGDYRVIANVVDPVFFETPYAEKNQEVKELLHVSCFTDEQKNISGLLRVVRALSEKRNDFHFTLVGDGEDFESLKSEAARLKIPPHKVEFTGLLEGKPLAEAMAKATALVLFSNYENMPVVINESFVLGVPVFSTNVGGIAEMVDEEHGVLVPKGDEQSLYKALNDFLDNRFSFDPVTIRVEAQMKFSQEAVGKDLLKIYRKALEKKKN
jgi:glycosyltransferase involved in cell wall biosynthesis